MPSMSSPSIKRFCDDFEIDFNFELLFEMLLICLKSNVILINIYLHLNECKLTLNE